MQIVNSDNIIILWSKLVIPILSLPVHFGLSVIIIERKIGYYKFEMPWLPKSGCYSWFSNKKLTTIDHHDQFRGAASLLYFSVSCFKHSKAPLDKCILDVAQCLTQLLDTIGGLTAHCTGHCVDLQKMEARKISLSTVCSWFIFGTLQASSIIVCEEWVQRSQDTHNSFWTLFLK